VTPKNKPASGKDTGTKKAVNTKEELEEKEKVVQEKAIDGERCKFIDNYWILHVPFNKKNIREIKKLPS